MQRFGVPFLQLLLAIIFTVIPVSRIFGAPTLQQVLSLGVPLWFIWIANVVELSGAVTLLLVSIPNRSWESQQPQISATGSLSPMRGFGKILSFPTKSLGYALGLRKGLLAAIGALLIASSMVGATLAHIRAGNLFAEVPWTLVFLSFCLIIVLFQWSAVQAALKSLQTRHNLSEGKV